MPSKQYYAEHREELKAKSLEHHYANRESRLIQMRKYRAEHKEEINRKNREWFLKNKDRVYDGRIDRVRMYNEALRTKVFDLLGDKCVRCGFNDKRALQIDHINGHGFKELVKIGSQAHYKKIIAMPDEERKKTYQILCANCNWIKKAENKEVRPRTRPIEKYLEIKMSD